MYIVLSFSCLILMLQLLLTANLSIKLCSKPTHGLAVFCTLFTGDLNLTSKINRLAYSKTKIEYKKII